MSISFAGAQNNVGIGTTSPNPNAILDLNNGNLGLGLLLPKVNVLTFIPAATDYGMFVYDTLQNQIFYWNGLSWNGVSPGWTLNGNAGTNSAINFIGTTDLQDFVFRTNNIERMRITSNGKLGVGSSAPANAKVQFLTPAGDAVNNTVLQLDNNYTGISSQYGILNNMGFGTNDKTGLFNILSNAATGSRITGVDSYIIPTGVGNEAMGFKAYIDNPGTGTRWALYADVLSTVSSTGPFFGAQYNMQNNSIGGTSYGVYVNSSGTSSNTYGVFTSGEDRNYFSGNVGIGVINPNVKLNVSYAQTSSTAAIITNEVSGGTGSVGGTKGLRVSISENANVQKIALEARVSGIGPGQQNAIFASADGSATSSFNRGVVGLASNNSITNIGFDAYTQGNLGTNYGVRSNVSGTQLNNKYAFFGNMSGSGTKYGVYVSGEDQNYFSGNVGIGTTTPDRPLKIFSTLAAGTNNGNIVVYNRASSQSNAFYGNSNNTGDDAGAFTYAEAFAAGYDNNPTGFNNFGLWGHQTDNGVAGWGVLASNGANKTAPTTYVALAGRTYSAYFMGGNVGINTPTPNSQLQFIQNDASIGGSSAIRYYWSGSYWRTFHSGIHYSFEDDGVRVAYVEGGSGNYVQPSDRALKKNISQIGTVLNDVTQLKPVSYHYTHMKNEDKKTIGFIAQEVEQIFPELVRTAEDGTKALSYSDFSIIAIKAIQEQQKQIEALQNEIRLLKDKN